MQSQRIFKILTFFAMSSCVGLMTYNMMEVRAEFSRNCVTAVHCVFEPRRSLRVFLDCQNGYCVCKNYGLIADVPVWDLKEDENNKCSIDDGGPCGRDKGLDISCSSGYECIDTRCRARAKIGTHKVGQVCMDDIDCQQGLECVITSFYFQATKSCVKPKSSRTTDDDDDDDKAVVATTTTTTTATVQPQVTTKTTTKSVQLINQRETDSSGSSGDGRNSTNAITSTEKPNESDLLDVRDEDDSPKISSNKASSSTFTHSVATFPCLFIFFFETVLACLLGAHFY